MSVWSPASHPTEETNKLCSQLNDLDSFSSQHPSIPLLKEVIKEFRDDELEHLDIAVDNFSQRAPAHAFLSSVVGAGCKIAIELCKKF
jgi:ubiquinone biosynthesis monooxygenase Coq7